MPTNQQPSPQPTPPQDIKLNDAVINNRNARIEVNTTKTVDVIAVRDTIDSYVSWITVLLSILSLGASVLTYLKVLKQPLSEVVSHLNPTEIRKRTIINSILMRMLIITGATRVVVGLFHNGEKMNNLSMQKMTIVYEAKLPEARSFRDLYKNVPIEKIYEELSSCNTLAFRPYHRDDPHIQERCAAYLDYSGLKSVFTRLLEDNEGCYGVVKIHFDDLVDNSVVLGNPKVESLYYKLSKGLEYIKDNRLKMLELLENEIL